MALYNVDIKRQIDQTSHDLIKSLEELTLNVINEVETRLKAESPVDTGKFRANWFTTEGTPSDQLTESVIPQPSYDKKIRIGQTYFVTNNSPYSSRLANGWSRQAPPGWIDVIVLDVRRKYR
jgi:hypothetical protein